MTKLSTKNLLFMDKKERLFLVTAASTCSITSSSCSVGRRGHDALERAESPRAGYGHAEQVVAHEVAAGLSSVHDFP
jgi:hypothetical protein